MKLQRILLSFSVLVLTAVICLNHADAQAKLAGLFTDGMVLQQKATVPVWGWDKPGAKITLTTSWSKKVVEALCDASGKFVLKVATPSAGGPYILTVIDGKPVRLSHV